MRCHHPLLLAFLLVIASGCHQTEPFPPVSAADSLATVRENLAHRDTVDQFFRLDPASPFQRDTTIAYTGIRWYSVDPRFRVHAPLQRYADPETVTVMGTRGEVRRHLRYGYFEFTLPDANGTAQRLRLNVYKFTPYDATRYAMFRDHLSVWFTDETTGTDTYEVGRYIDIGTEHPDSGHSYEIDFNTAYNPYCAYSGLYSCAIPREEDHLAIPIRAGERRYHD